MVPSLPIPGKVLTDFPLRIDPLIGAIELSVRDRPGGRKRAAVFARVEPGPDDLGFPRRTNMAHFFGDGPDVWSSATMIVYDGRGYLRFRVNRDASGNWADLAQFHDEEVGSPAAFPSVRLVFSDPEAAGQFAALVRDVYEGGDLPAGLAGFLQDHLAEPPRQLDVAPL